jgi:predicted phage terminase large subunit-like protein
LDLTKTHPRQLASLLDDELATRDLGAFCRRGCQDLDPQPLQWSWHLDAMAEHLQAVTEGQIKRLLINIPPRMTKSTLTSVFWPAWHWGRFPGTRFLVCSAVENVVMRDAMRAHDLMDSHWFRRAFGVDWSWSKSQDSKGYYQNSVGGARASKTVGSRLQGVDADILIIDDPLDTRDASPSRVALETHRSWFFEIACQRLTREDTPIVVIMQRLHEADLAGALIERGGYDQLILPAIAEDETRIVSSLGFVDPRKPGQYLCNRITADYIAEKRADLGERGFAAQMQQRPSPAEGAVFKKDWLRFWDAMTLPAAFDFKVSSWDTPFRAGRSNDWCVGQVWGVRGANIYLLEQVRKRIGFEQTLDEIRAQHARHPGIRATIVELAANGPAIVEAMKQEIPGLLGVRHQGETKDSRANASTARWAAGQVYVPHPHVAQWVERWFIPELLGFPVSRHDDQVDAMTQAIIWINQQQARFDTPWVM